MAALGDLRRTVKSASFRGFLLLDRLGVHVLPKHYYTPVSDRAWLRDNRPLWQRPLSLAGVEWDLDDQLAWLE